MFFSEQTDKLMPAVIKAWAGIEAAVKNATNPHLKNHYADLASLMDAIKPAMTENGLAVFQPVAPIEGDMPGATVETYIIHSSGQWMMSQFAMRSNDSKPQAIGATITYLRRYALGAMLGMVSEVDDDGNAGSGVTQTRQQPQRQAAPPRQTKAALGVEPQPEAEQKPSNPTEDAKTLRNKLMELTGADINTVKQYFKGLWPNGSPKESAEYIKPLTDIIAYVSRGEQEQNAFKADPVKFGDLWTKKNAPQAEAKAPANMSIDELANIAAKANNLQNGTVLMKTLDKMFSMKEYHTGDSMIKFLKEYEINPAIFDEARAAAELGFTLDEMMNNRVN